MKSHWDSTLLLSGETDLIASVFCELRQYFPSLQPQEIEHRFWNSTELMSNHWKKLKVNPRSEESLVQFYNETELEIFELMNYHSADWDQGPMNYVFSLELAKRHRCQTYLDYGSGVGSGGILFAKSGFDVTLCDIATPLLEFAKWRFRIRGLEANFVDLKQEKPSSQVDIVTCFEVLEHLKDPLKTLRQIHGYLREGGFLIVTAPFCKDEQRPMHIVHDNRIIERFRGQGFHMRWDLKDPLRGKVHEPFFIMQKVKRSKIKNALFEFFDYYIPETFKSVAFRMAGRKKKYENIVHSS